MLSSQKRPFLILLKFATTRATCFAQRQALFEGQPIESALDIKDGVDPAGRLRGPAPAFRPVGQRGTSMSVCEISAAP